MRAPRVALITLAILLVSAPAALACDAGSFDPADQPPFGGQTTTLSRPLPPGAQGPGVPAHPRAGNGARDRGPDPPGIGASLRDPNPDRPRPSPAVAGRLLRWGGQGRRAGGDRGRRGMRAGDVDRDPGRHQARPGIPGRGLGQGEQLVDLAAPLRSLHGAVRRPEAAASPDPSRPAGAARLQRLTRLLQPREGRSLGRARLSGAGLCLPAHAGRRVQAVREPRSAPAAGATELAGGRHRRPGRIPHRLRRDRREGDRRRPGRRDRRRSPGQGRRHLWGGGVLRHADQGRRLWPRQLPGLRAVRAGIPVERELGRGLGRARCGARVRAAHRPGAVRARTEHPSGT